jgi:hypothetical protein
MMAIKDHRDPIKDNYFTKYYLQIKTWIKVKIPFLRYLKDCSGEVKSEALKELLTTLIISFLPIIIGCLVAFLANHKINIIYNIYNNLSNGELFLYITSLLAPIIYILLKESKDKKFPDLLIHVGIYALIIGTSAIVFAMKRINFMFDNISLNIIQYSLFPLSLLLMYSVIAYNNYIRTLSPANQMQKDEEQFTDSLKEHRRKIK